MPMFKLPKLQQRVPIVDSLGRPLAYFLRFLNDEYSGAIERQEQSQAEIIAELQAVQQELADQLAQILAAQAAADAAQATADDALALALDANGAKYLPIDGPFDISAVAENVTADVKLDLLESVMNVTIDADTSIDVLVTLEEFDGATPIAIGTQAFTLTSTGLQNPDLSWNTSAANATISGFGSYIDTVTYRLNLTRVSGANFVSKGDGSGTLTMIPRVTP